MTEKKEGSVSELWFFARGYNVVEDRYGPLGIGVHEAIERHQFQIDIAHLLRLDLLTGRLTDLELQLAAIIVPLALGIFTLELLQRRDGVRSHSHFSFGVSEPVKRSIGMRHLHAGDSLERAGGAFPVVLVDGVVAFVVKVLLLFNFRLLFFFFVVAGQQIGADGRRADDACQKSGGKNHSSIHSEVIPFCGGAAGLSWPLVCALITRTLNSNPFESMRFCSAAASSGDSFPSECAISCRTGSRSESTLARRSSPRCSAVCR